MQKAGIDPDKPHVAVNTHDWGQAPEMREKLVLRISELCDYMVIKHRLQILFVPMVKSDERTIVDCMGKMQESASLLKYDYDYRVVRAAIGHAELCLTLKHHPIIFAMANRVPTISVAVDDYYLHKNKGALALFEMGEWVLDQHAIFRDNAKILLARAINEREHLSKRIATSLAEMEAIVVHMMEDFCLKAAEAPVPLASPL